MKLNVHKSTMVLGLLASSLAGTSFSSVGFGTQAPPANPTAPTQPVKLTVEANELMAMQSLSIFHASEVKGALVMLGRIQEPELVQLASTLARDHLESEIALSAFAVSKQFELCPSAPSESLVALKSKSDENVRALEGSAQADVKATYVKAIIASHEEAMAQLTELAQSAQDAELKSAIQQALTAEQTHLEQAQRYAGATSLTAEVK